MKFIFDEMKKKTYTFDIGEQTYSVQIKKTLIVDQIPHQPPSLMGRVTYKQDKILKFDSLVFSKLKFDFTIERPPCFDDDLLEILPAFDTSTIHVPLVIVDAITTCIKDYYHDFLSSMK